MGEHHVIVHKVIELFGLNLSITNFVVILWLGAVFTFLFLVGAARCMKEDGSGRFANLVESMLDFVRLHEVREASRAVLFHRYGLFLHLVQQPHRPDSRSRLLSCGHEQSQCHCRAGHYRIPCRPGRGREAARSDVLREAAFPA